MPDYQTNSNHDINALIIVLIAWLDSVLLGFDCGTVEIVISQRQVENCIIWFVVLNMQMSVYKIQE